MADLTLRGQYEEARELAATGQLDKGLDVCLRILHAFPRHVATYEVLGRICLQKGEHEEAANLFRRVLSADPESTLAYASLGAIYEERGLLDEAIWQMERAIELSPGNREIRTELRRMYSKRDLGEPERIKLTRAALARTFLRGQLYAKAIGELRDVVSQAHDRYDLRLALGEALWRDGRRQDSEAVYQGILAELPNCLKANLILGRIWLGTDRDDEARLLLSRAQALDPDNAVAQAILGPQSPLPPRIARLPMREDDVPPLDLPYLGDVERDEFTIDVPVPSGSGKDDAGVAPPTRSLLMIGDDAEMTAARSGSARSPSALSEGDPGHGAEPKAQPVDEPRDEHADQRMRGMQDLIVQELVLKLESAPNDDHARLTLARRLAEFGRLSQAADHYRALMARGPRMLATAIRDLENLQERNPDSIEVSATLRQAHDARERLLSVRR